MAEEDRLDTKVQARVSPEIKTDLKILAEKQGVTLGAFAAKILTLFWTNKKRKGEC